MKTDVGTILSGAVSDLSDNTCVMDCIIEELVLLGYGENIILALCLSPWDTRIYNLFSRKGRRYILDKIAKYADEFHS